MMKHDVVNALPLTAAENLKLDLALELPPLRVLEWVRDAAARWQPNEGATGSTNPDADWATHVKSLRDATVNLCASAVAMEGVVLSLRDEGDLMTISAVAEECDRGASTLLSHLEAAASGEMDAEERTKVAVFLSSARLARERLDLLREELATRLDQVAPPVADDACAARMEEPPQIEIEPAPEPEREPERDPAPAPDRVTKRIEWSVVDLDGPVFDVGTRYAEEFRGRVLLVKPDGDRSIRRMVNWVLGRDPREITLVNTGPGPEIFDRMAPYWRVFKDHDRRVILCWVIDNSLHSCLALEEVEHEIAPQIGGWLVVKNCRGSLLPHRFFSWDGSAVKERLIAREQDRFREIAFPGLDEATARRYEISNLSLGKTIQLAYGQKSYLTDLEPLERSMLLQWQRETTDLWSESNICLGDIVFVCGGKGGVGKSTVASTLAHFLSTAVAEVKLYAA